jgi:hypothetical protein
LFAFLVEEIEGGNSLARSQYDLRPPGVIGQLKERIPTLKPQFCPRFTVGVHEYEPLGHDDFPLGFCRLNLRGVRTGLPPTG